MKNLTPEELGRKLALKGGKSYGIKGMAWNIRYNTILCSYAGQTWIHGEEKNVSTFIDYLRSNNINAGNLWERPRSGPFKNMSKSYTVYVMFKLEDFPELKASHTVDTLSHHRPYYFEWRKRDSRPTVLPMQEVQRGLQLEEQWAQDNSENRHTIPFFQNILLRLRQRR